MIGVIAKLFIALCGSVFMLAVLMTLDKIGVLAALAMLLAGK